MNPKIVGLDFTAIPLLTAEEAGMSQVAAEKYFRLGGQVQAAVQASEESGYLVVVKLPGYSVLTGSKYLVVGSLAREYVAHEALEYADVFNIVTGWT